MILKYTVSSNVQIASSDDDVVDAVGWMNSIQINRLKNEPSGGNFQRWMQTTTMYVYQNIL